MPSNKKLLALACLIAIAWLLCLTCTKNNPANTNTGTVNLSGVLYNADGTKAANAKVKLVAAGFIPNNGGAGKILAASDSAVTQADANGNYAIDSLPANTYNIFGAGTSGNLCCYKDSIKVAADSHTVVPPDTLKAPGTIKGIIQMQPGDDARKVFILFLGTTTWAVPADSLGNFVTPAMAGGTYRVEILPTLDQYNVMITSLTIKAGKDSVLTDTIKLEYTGIPVPKNVRIVYDTAMEVVTLMWNKADTSLVKSYNVYRSNVDSNSVATILNTSPLTDTVYRDGSGTDGQTYAYKVVALDKNGNMGKFCIPLRATFTSAFITILTTTGGNNPGQLLGPHEISFDLNSNLYINDAYHIQVFDTAINYKEGLFTSFLNGTRWPSIIALGNGGEFFVAYSTSSNKAFLATFNSTGTLLDTMPLPGGAFDFDSVRQTFFFYNHDSLFEILPNGLVKRKCNCSSTSTWGSIIAGGASRIFVSDRNINNVSVFDTTGALITTIVKQIAADSLLEGIAYDRAKDRLYLNFIRGELPSQKNYLEVVDVLSNRLIAAYKVPAGSGPFGENIPINVSHSGFLYLIVDIPNNNSPETITFLRQRTVLP